MTREEPLEWFKDRKKMNLDDKCQQAEDMAIKALEQEPCEDEYIKVPKKALKYRTVGMVAYNAEWLKNHFDIERAVICGDQQPCEDAISRQAVLDLIRHYNSDGLGSVFYGYEEGVKFANAVNKLPSVIPQPKTGHWIICLTNADTFHHCECSECSSWAGEVTDYCSNCGAKMVKS